jgi:hypothetical protein
VNWKRSLKLGLLVVTLVLALLPAAVVLADGGTGTCPKDHKIYVGGAATNPAGVRGSKENPVTDIGEAWDVCSACTNGGYIYVYDSNKLKYYGRGSCGLEWEEGTGVPLAQSLVIGAVAVLAVAVLAWGIYTRVRLRS